MHVFVSSKQPVPRLTASPAPLPPQALEAAFGVPVLEAYAMTEASHQMTSNPLPKHGARKPGSVGKPQGSVQVAVLDTSNALLPPGQASDPWLARM